MTYEKKTVYNSGKYAICPKCGREVKVAIGRYVAHSTKKLDDVCEHSFAQASVDTIYAKLITPTTPSIPNHYRRDNSE